MQSSDRSSEDLLRIVAADRQTHSPEDVAAAEAELRARLSSAQAALSKRLRRAGAIAAFIGFIAAAFPLLMLVVEAPWAQPAGDRTVPWAFLAAGGVQVLAGSALFVGGLGLRSGKNWARKVLLVIVWCGIVYCLGSAVVWEIMVPLTMGLDGEAIAFMLFGPAIIAFWVLILQTPRKFLSSQEVRMACGATAGGSREGAHAAPALNGPASKVKQHGIWLPFVCLLGVALAVGVGWTLVSMARRASLVAGLHEAAEQEDAARIEAILQAHPELADAKDEEGLTVLHQAVMASDVRAAKALLGLGADVNATAEGVAPLHWAALWGSRELVEVLLAAGAELHQRDEQGFTPLHMAAMSGNPPVAQLLLERGARPWAEDNDGRTPLHVAANGDIAALLVDGGVDLNGISAEGETALHLAASRGSTGKAEFLLSKGAEVNARDRKGYTPLHKAVRYHSFNADGEETRGLREMAELLLEHGADVNVKDREGSTVLHWAAEMGWVDWVEFLLGNSADIEAKDRHGRTPLYRAATYEAAFFGGRKVTGQPAAVERLLERGADVNARDGGGRTPLSAAVEKGHSEVAALLRRHGAVE